MTPVPIMFNIKNGQFSVTIARARGIKGSFTTCSPSLKGIRDAIIADSVPQPKSTFGKLFGTKSKTRRMRRSQRARRN
jgi:hypothetical protein